MGGHQATVVRWQRPKGGRGPHLVQEVLGLQQALERQVVRGQEGLKGLRGRGRSKGVQA